MKRSTGHRVSAFTLIEVMLVTAILVLLATLAVPRLIDEIRGQTLPRSAHQLRSLLTMVRAHAAYDGKRYQIRFPLEDGEDEEVYLLDDRQPIIEREDDPVNFPEEFNQVTDPWSIGKTFLGKVWCSKVRIGRPTIELLQNERQRAAETIERKLDETQEDYEPERLPLQIEPDGTSLWVTFELTSAPRDTDIDELEDFPRIHVILDGETGLAWLQRPFYDEELDLFEEKGWPAVLRQDFLSTRELTEDDVLEIRESGLRGEDVKLKGRELETDGSGDEVTP